MSTGAALRLVIRLGATGCRLVVTLIHEMVKEKPPEGSRISLRRWRTWFCSGSGKVYSKETEYAAINFIKKEGYL